MSSNRSLPLLLVTFAVVMSTNASEPKDDDIASLSDAFQAAEKESVEAARLLRERVAEVSAGSCDLPKQELEKRLKAKGLKSNDCSHCHESDDSKLNDMLKGPVSRAFDLRMKFQRAQLADAESKLKATREHLNRRDKIRDKIIGRRIDQLIGGADSSWLGSASAQSKLEPASDSTGAILKPIDPGGRQQKGSLGEFDQLWQDLIGLSFINSNDPLPDRYKGCVKVTEVKRGSPAAKAGLSPGDLLIGLNGWGMINVHAMDAVLRQRLEGNVSSRIKMYVIRDGTTYKGTLVLPDSIVSRDRQSREALVKLVDDALIGIDKQIAERKKKSASSSGPAKADPVAKAMISTLAEKIASSRIEGVSLETKLSGLKKMQTHELYLRLSKLNGQIKEETDKAKLLLLVNQRVSVMQQFNNLLSSTYNDSLATPFDLPGMIEAAEQKLQLHSEQQNTFEFMLSQQYDLIEVQRKIQEGGHASFSEQLRDELLSKKREIEKGISPK